MTARSVNGGFPPFYSPQRIGNMSGTVSNGRLVTSDDSVKTGNGAGELFRDPKNIVCVTRSFPTWR